MHFTHAPDSDEAFEVGDRLKCFATMRERRARPRIGWKGIVVQVDHKMVAVQFRENVYLTDGWMVPDHVLWYPMDSENIRHVARRRKKPRLRPTRMDFG